MKQNLLSLLGCSGSIALILTTNPAQANTSKEYVFTAPDINSDRLAEAKPTSDEKYSFFDCSCSEYDAEALEKSEREEELAIERFGCDCAGCRNIVRGTLEDDSLI